MSPWPKRRLKRGAKLLMIGAAATVIAGCATPGGTPSSTAPGTRFDETAWEPIRRSIESRGWAAVFGAMRPDPVRGGVVESRYFLSPASIVRHANVVRARTLVAYAVAWRVMSTDALSATQLQEFNCANRTFQILSSEHFRDQGATQRVVELPVAAPVQVVAPGSPAELLLHAVCTGRYAKAGATSATPFPPPRRSGTGSGVAVAARHVLTNAHVTTNCGSLDAIVGTTTHPATVRKVDAAADLALLEVPGLTEVKPPMLRRQALVGEPVIAAGFPLSGLLGADIVITDGLVNSLSGMRGDASRLQVSTPVQPGSSGGPLLDRGGHVVGIVTSMLVLTSDAAARQMTQNVNFAVKPETVAGFLQSEKLPLQFTDDSGNLSTQAVAARARDFTVKVRCKP